MRSLRCLAAILIAFALSVPLIADEAAQTSAAETLAVFDTPESKNRHVLYDATSGEPSVSIRSRIDAKAKTLGKTTIWVPFKRSQFEQELQKAVSETPLLAGIQLTRTSFQFSDAENVAVLLDVTLPRSSMEEPLVNAANNILTKLHTSPQINFGARPGIVQLQIPQSESVLLAINEDLAKPELRLAGCSITKLTFIDNGDDSRSTLLDGTLAFQFQADGAISAIQGTLSRLGHEDWDKVRPIDSGFHIQPPDMSLFLAELKQALRDSDATDLAVILCDATLEPSTDAPGQLFVNLNGYISMEQTEALVVDIANEVATTFFGPYLAREEDDQTINVLPNDLVLRATSRSASRQFVRLAHAYTQECRFVDAVNAFEMAAFEDRQAMNTMYWLAIAHLRLGDEDEARTILRRTVRINARLMEEARQGRINGYADLMHVLESVQGTLRQRLHELEGQVYADYCKKSRRRA